MSKVSEIKKGNDNCNHKWVSREKKTIQVLLRVCPDCGKEEIHSESNISETEAKKLLKVI